MAGVIAYFSFQPLLTSATVAGISSEMAVRLAKAFGSAARVWLDIQAAYDLSCMDPAQIDVKPYKRNPLTV